MKTILIIVGTRPNFIKVTQFKKEAKKHPDFSIKIVHTGQHFDKNMADIFFQELDLTPDYFLDISEGTPIHQMAQIMSKLSKLIENIGTPDLIIVPGDVNSTLAAAITANKMNIPLAHLESGLRSFDREMPEEQNRILTDEISDYYFITEKSGEENLRKEQKSGKRFLVGNTMIDTLVHFETEINASQILEKFNLDKDNYVLVTLHRPSNVDSESGRKKIIELFGYLNTKYKIIFPIHPRTLKGFEKSSYYDNLTSLNNLKLVSPFGYFDFQKLIKNTCFVLTDSGGIQEETTYRQIPCLTLRNNTERPITISEGTNTLVPFDVEVIKKHIHEIETGKYKTGKIPELWDGKSTERILEHIAKLI